VVLKGFQDVGEFLDSKFEDIDSQFEEMDGKVAALECNKKQSRPKIQNGILFPHCKGREEVDELHDHEGGDVEVEEVRAL
jgi:hypothetical protein